MRSITVAFKYFFLYFLHLCSYLFGRVATLSFAARNNRNRKRAFEEVARWLTSNGGGQSTYPSPPSFPSLPPLSLACSRDLNDAELVFFSLLLFLSASSAARFPVIENFRVCSFYSIFFFCSCLVFAIRNLLTLTRTTRTNCCCHGRRHGEQSCANTTALTIE